jgi:hypothetical protein
LNRQDLCLVTLPIMGLAVEMMYFEGFFSDFWTIVTVFSAALVALPTLYSILRGRNFKISLAMIVMSSTFVQVIYFLSFKNVSYVPPRDAAYDFQVINAIVVNGKIPLGEGVGQALAYSYYPGMHSLLGVLGMITGLDPVMIVKLSPLLYIMIPMALYVLTYRLTGQRMAAGLAAFVLIFVPYGFYSPKYNFLALTFFLFLILSLSLYLILKRASLLVMSLFFALVLGMTHHLTSYILFGFLFSILLAGFVFGKTRWKIKWSQWNSIKLQTLALMLVVMVWPFFVGSKILSYHMYVFLDLLGRLGIGQHSSIPFLTGSYSTLELYLILASLAFLLMLGLAGFAIYLRDGHSSPMLILMIVLFGSLFLVAYSVRSLSELSEELSLRTWCFLFLGLAPVIGYITAKIREPSYSSSKARAVRFSKLENQKRRFLSSLVIFLIISCYAFSAVDLIPRPYYDFNEENETGMASSLRGFGEKVAASIRWYNITRSSTLIAIGDGIVQDMSAPFTFEIESRYDFYYAPATYAKILPGSGYILVDSSFAIYDQTPQWKVVMKRVDLENVTEVVNTAQNLSRIYDNGLVSIIFKER